MTTVETVKGPLTVKRALAGILIFQLGLAVMLFAGDIADGFVRTVSPSQAPSFDQPLSPGDQRRIYDPSPRRTPGIETAEPMPVRLQVEEISDGIIKLHGAIEEGDADTVKAALDARSTPPEMVLLNSPGGLVAEALTIGKYLRSKDLRTGVDANAICLSACPYIFAAGTERVADGDARIGVHQHYFGENTLLPAFIAVEDIQRGQGLVLGYLVDMGIDPRVMEPALLTPPDEIYILLPEELSDFQLATEIGDPAP